MIYILAGEIETGKSSALYHWANKRSDVFGILSPKNDCNERYFLDIHSKKSFRMEARTESKDTLSVGRYCFNKTAFKRANTIITAAIKKTESGFILIDELGKLEIRSEGLHYSAVLAIDKAKHHNHIHIILVVRTYLLELILKKYNITNYKYITAEDLKGSHIDYVTMVTNKGE